MPPEMTFEEELHELLARSQGMPFEMLEPLVIELHRKHNREVSPPITGTMAIVEPKDKFGG